MGPEKQSNGRHNPATLALVPLARQVLLPDSAARVSLSSWDSRSDHAPRQVLMAGERWAGQITSSNSQQSL